MPLLGPSIPQRLAQDAREIDGHLATNRFPSAWGEEIAPKVSTAMKALALYLNTNDETILDELRKLDVSGVEKAVADLLARAEAKGVVTII